LPRPKDNSKNGPNRPQRSSLRLRWSVLYGHHAGHRSLPANRYKRCQFPLAEFRDAAKAIALIRAKLAEVQR
jgi:hypothetical protein